MFVVYSGLVKFSMKNFMIYRGNGKNFKQARPSYHTLFENDSITDINYPELFSLFYIDTWWGQSKYVRKFEISQANFEKT